MSRVVQVHWFLHLTGHELDNPAIFSQQVGTRGWSCAYTSCRVRLGSAFALPWAHLGFLVGPGRESAPSSGELEARWGARARKIRLLHAIHLIKPVVKHG